MPLLVVVLRIENVMLWPMFLLKTTNWPVSSIESLGKLLSSELKQICYQKWKRSKGETSQVEPVATLTRIFWIVELKAWFNKKKHRSWQVTMWMNVRLFYRWECYSAYSRSNVVFQQSFDVGNVAQIVNHQKRGSVACPLPYWMSRSENYPKWAYP